MYWPGHTLRHSYLTKHGPVNTLKPELLFPLRGRSKHNNGTLSPHKVDKVSFNSLMHPCGDGGNYFASEVLELAAILQHQQAWIFIFLRRQM